MILPPDYESRTLDAVRRIVDDIPECASAEISVEFVVGHPRLRFAFGDPSLRARPLLLVGLIAQSKQNPLSPGRLLGPEQLQRHVRDWVEEYFRIQGTPITQMVSNAQL